MARPTNTEQRRTQIANALVRVMAREGYAGASVGDIAAAARLAPGIVHYHFKDKQEILLIARRTLVDRHTQRLAEIVSAAAPDFSRQVAAFIDFHLGLGATADPETLACWVMLSGEALRQPRIRGEYEKAVTAFAGLLTSVIERGVKAKAFRCKRPDAAASALVAAIQGYFVLAAVARPAIPRGSAAKATMEMAEGLLRPVTPIELQARDGSRRR